MKAKLIAGLATVLALLSPATSVLAQGYPNRPIKIIVPYTPGDGPDVIARLIGNKISERLGQAVVIDNRAGASGQIGLELTAKAPPDGYTLGVGLVTNLALAPAAYKSIPYDTLKDFTPVALGAINYLALVARPDAPFKNVAEMIQWAKSNPGKMTIGTTSTGGLPHMSFEMLAHMSGFKFLNVPYKGNGPVVTDLTGGRLDLGVTSYTSIAGLADSGRLKVLGITNPARDPALPNLPTIGETVKGYAAPGWFGFVAPAGTPPEIVNKLNDEINRAIKLPDVQKTMGTLGLIPQTGSPEDFARLIRSDNEKFAKLVKDISYQPQ
ncbi:MAG: Bug family tripartite tricarboxylate transporter substrate binding protein [Ramlibacter sp.]